MPGHSAALRRLHLLLLLTASTVLLGAATPAHGATLAQTKARLRSAAAALPGASGVYVRESATNTVLVSRNASARRIPASVTKLFTTSTALIEDGPASVLTTQLRMRGTVGDDGILRGQLILRGAGDPSLSAARVATLAVAIKKLGITRLEGTLRADLAGWSTDQGTGSTGGAYNREIGGRMGGLVVARGFASPTVMDPARQALIKLREAMRAQGLRGPVKFAAPAPSGAGTTVIAETPSPTIAQLAASTNVPSDNFYAEQLLRGVGARHGGSGTTAAGLAVERAVLRRLGVSATLADGSGLSRGNRVAPSMVVRLLDRMAARNEGTALRASLPLAGATGTLSGRMRGTAAAGRCRAKTGTLSNVSALAGWCTTRGGRRVSFAILMNGVSVPTARARQDRIAAAIADWTDRPAATATTPTTTPTTPTTPSTTPVGGGASF